MAASKSAGGGGGAVRAGRAFVELFTSDVKLVRGLEQAKKKLESWAKTIAKVSLAAGAAGGGILAPITKLFTDAVSRSSELDTLSKKFGETTENVSTLATGFEKAGVNLDEFGGFLDGLAGKIKSTADANTALIDGLESMPELNGRALMGMNLDKQLDTIAEAISRVKSEQDRVTVANDLGLGKLLPWLKKGKAGIDELRKSGKLGLVTTEQGEQAKKIMTAYTDAIQSFKYAALEVGVALFGSAGDVSNMSTQIKEGSKAAGDWIRDNKELIVSAVKIGAGLIAAGVALSLFASLLGTLGTVAGVVATVLTGLGAVIAFVFSPAGLLLAGLAAGVVGLATLTETGRETMNALSDGSEEFSHTFKTGWASVVSAVERGDLEGAFAVIMASLEVAWAKAMKNMTEAWVALKRQTTSGAEDIRQFIGGGVLFAGVLTGQVSRAEAQEQYNLIHGEMRSDADAAREAESQRQLADADEALAAAKAKLGEVLGKESVKEAEFQKKKRETAAKAAEKPGFVPTPKMSDLPKIANVARKLFDAQKGIFSGPVAQQLGYGDNTAKRQLDATEDIAKNAAVLPAVLNAVQNINGPKFK